MSTQAWGFRALLGCRRKAPSPPKGRKVGCDAGGHPSPWPLIFSLCRRRVECVPHATAHFPGVRRIWKCRPPPRTDRGAQKQRKEGLQPDEAAVETGAARAGGGVGR